MKKGKDLVGLRVGRLTVIRFSHISVDRRNVWECVCDCGSIKLLTSKYIGCGRVNSCGCLKKELLGKRRATHNRSGSPEYIAWTGMKHRCYNSKCKDYKNYGGRGIKVCERWINSFENFLKDLGPKPKGKYSIDRIDVDGDYKPSNCKWSTDAQQGRNKRVNVWVEHNGVSMIVSDWASYFGINSGNLTTMMKRKSFPEIYSFYEKRNLNKNK